MRRETEGEAAILRGLERIGRERICREHGTEPVMGPAMGPVVDPVVVRPPGRHAREVARLSSRPSWMPEFAPAHLLAVATAVVLALGLTAWLFLRSAPRAVDAPVAHTAATSTPTGAAIGTPSGTPTGTPSSLVPGAAASAVGSVVVDVAGKVRRPGIVRLPAGARVIDALRRAGGARHRADLSTLNLARPLTDGEQILVGRGATAPGAVAGAPASTGSAGAASGGPVHLNTATLTELDSLPGVGPVTAQKILDWRSAHGRFSAIDELLEVDGIGDKTMADIAPHVTL